MLGPTRDEAGEAVLDGECRCEYGHFGVTPCSALVTHRVSGCACDDFNVCSSAVAVIETRLTRDRCVDCGRGAGDCWSIRPI